MSYAAPAIYRPTSIMVTTRSFESIGGFGTRGISTGASASTVWPTANKALFVPVTLGGKATFVKAFWYNGATVAGNVDVGLYLLDGTRVASTGAIAQSGTSALQENDMTDFTVGPGRYYLAIGFSNGTATVVAQVPTAASQLAALGCAEMASAMALPATATLALNTIALLPLFGFSQRTSVVT